MTAAAFSIRIIALVAMIPLAVGCAATEPDTEPPPVPVVPLAPITLENTNHAGPIRAIFVDQRGEVSLDQVVAAGDMVTVAGELAQHLFVLEDVTFPGQTTREVRVFLVMYVAPGDQLRLGNLERGVPTASTVGISVPTPPNDPTTVYVRSTCAHTQTNTFNAEIQLKIPADCYRANADVIMLAGTDASGYTLLQKNIAVPLGKVEVPITSAWVKNQSVAMAAQLPPGYTKASVSATFESENLSWVTTNGTNDLPVQGDKVVGMATLPSLEGRALYTVDAWYDSSAGGSGTNYMARRPTSGVFSVDLRDKLPPVPEHLSFDAEANKIRWSEAAQGPTTAVRALLWSLRSDLDITFFIIAPGPDVVPLSKPEGAVQRALTLPRVPEAIVPYLPNASFTTKFTVVYNWNTPGATYQDLRSEAFHSVYGAGWLSPTVDEIATSTGSVIEQ